MIFPDVYRARFLCEHCGEWHYGRAATQADADAQAQRKEESCGRSRELAGELPVYKQTPKETTA